MADLRILLIQLLREPLRLISLELLRSSSGSAVHCRLPLDYKHFLHALLRTAAPLLLKVGETRHDTGNPRSKSKIRMLQDVNRRMILNSGHRGNQNSVFGFVSDFGFRASDFEGRNAAERGSRTNSEILRFRQE